MSNIDSPSYEDLIHEVFIDPIRSVLIIDDDYPTIYESLFYKKHPLTEETTRENKETHGRYLKKRWHTSFNKIGAILSSFRDRNWIVDIDDGANLAPEVLGKAIGHLHQSDLLILDYQLDGDDPTKSLSIIQHLAENTHFNQVVVHTNHDKLPTVFNDIVVSLLKPCDKIEGKAGLAKNFQSKIEEWADDDEQIRTNLGKCFDTSLYLETIQDPIASLQEANSGDGGKYHKMVSLMNKAPLELKINLAQLFYWLLFEHQQLLKPKFSQSSKEKQPSWSSTTSDILCGENWIRTDRLFITVASKNSESHTLPEILHQALVKWHPMPPRLILTKLRTLMQGSGVSSEDHFLQDVHLQAGWYYNLLSSEDHTLVHKSNETAAIYWEGLARSLTQDTIVYTKRLIDADKRNVVCNKEIIQNRFKCDFTDEEVRLDSAIRQNVYNCSVSPHGEHLSTGHILHAFNNYWICASPACDLVPGRNATGRRKHLGNKLDFTAIQLYPVEKEEALEKIQTGSYVCLDIDGKVKFFKTTPTPTEGKDKKSGEKQPEQNTEANPTTYEMYAHNEGVFVSNSDLKLTISRVKNSESGGLQFENSECLIVAQLRYEYALNQLHKFGQSRSRVGLGFVDTK